MQEINIVESRVQEVALSEINLDRETQIRVAVSEETVQRYYEVMEDKAGRDQFPPILLFQDEDGKYWLADGHHRVMAAQQRNFKTIRAVIQPGTKADAIWEAAKANGRNGLQLGRADIRRAVEMMLTAFPDQSNRAIADNVGCSESYVRKIYDQLRTSAQLPERTSSVGKDEKRRQIKQVKEKTKTIDASRLPEDWDKPEDDAPPFSRPILKKNSQFLEGIKLKNISLKKTEGLIAYLFDRFSAEYREKFLFDLAAQMTIDDGKTLLIVQSSETDEPIVAEESPEREAVPELDEFLNMNNLPNENGEYYLPLSQPIPERYSQFEQSVELQNISLDDPEALIAYLFDLFSAEYRERLLFDLVAKMKIDDGKKWSVIRTPKRDAPVATEETVESENTPEPTSETVESEFYPEPPCPNKDIKYFPKTTLKLIPQESPRVLLVNLFEIFRKGFVEEMIIMAMEMLVEENGKAAAQNVLRQLNEMHDAEPVVENQCVMQS